MNFELILFESFHEMNRFKSRSEIKVAMFRINDIWYKNPMDINKEMVNSIRINKEAILDDTGTELRLDW